jgi:anti-sigma regulatory factor (Ser/Thr protein kinase)
LFINASDRDEKALGDMKNPTVPKELQVEESGARTTIRFPSNRALVDAAITASEAHLKNLGLERNVSALVSLRELLVNATVHGNKCDPSKLVTCYLKATPDGGLNISVENEGQGFDPQLLDLRLPEDPKQIRKRGLILVKNLAETMEFEAGGTRVMAYFNPPEDFEIR